MIFKPNWIKFEVICQFRYMMVQALMITIWNSVWNFLLQLSDQMIRANTLINSTWYPCDRWITGMLMIINSSYLGSVGNWNFVCIIIIHKSYQILKAQKKENLVSCFSQNYDSKFTRIQNSLNCGSWFSQNFSKV